MFHRGRFGSLFRPQPYFCATHSWQKGALSRFDIIRFVFSRKVAVTLPELRLCFSKNLLGW